MPRMPDCGEFRIGVDISEPNTPPLVIVNVPPCNSSSFSLLSRARRPKSWILASIWASDELVGIAHHRHDQAALGRNRDADVVVVLVDDVVAFDLGIDVGQFLQRGDAGLDEEAHEAEPHAVLLLEAVLVLGAQRHDMAHVDFVEGRELGGGVLRFLQAQRDGLAQPGHRHAFLAVGVRARAGVNRRGSGRAVRSAARASSASSMSPLVTRPSLPVPATRERIDAAFFGDAAHGRHDRVHRRLRGCGASASARVRRAWRRGFRRGSDGFAAGARGGAGLGAFGDGAENRADLNRVAFLHRNGFDRAVGGRGHFHRHLVGFQFEQRLVARDRVAFLLEPVATPSPR